MQISWSKLAIALKKSIVKLVVCNHASVNSNTK